MREKKGESNDCGWEMAENRRTFANKFVMISPVKDYELWWRARSMSYLSNGF